MLRALLFVVFLPVFSRKWLNETGSEMKIVFNVFKDLDFEIYEKLLNG